jgi:alpha-beta hydrolase superfamily lysophospholipase
MEERTDHFNGPDGRRIFYRHFPVDAEKARLFLAHGLGEHSGRYRHVIRRLGGLGISVWAPDHRGHGRSEGRRGHVSAFEHYAEDLLALFDSAADKSPAELPHFLLGHSLGGLIVLYFALQHPDRIDAVVASSPALGVRSQVPPAKKILGRMMSAVWPTLSLSNELEVDKISHDAAVVSAYRNDPLVHDRVSARWYTEVLGTMQYVVGNAHRIAVPVLLQVAGDDHLVDAEASRRFFEALSTEDKRLIVYDGLYHEIYNEPEPQAGAVMTDLTAWLKARIPGAV